MNDESETASPLADAVEAVRRPEHTGDNRCRPCTIVNAALLGAFAALLWPLSAVAAAGVAAVGAAAIWLRGYLVPYTPRFAPRIAAALPGDRFEKPTPEPVGSIGETASDEELADALLAELRRRGVLVVDGEALFLSAPFREAWTDEMASLRALPLDELAEAVADASPGCTDAAAAEGRRRDHVILEDHEADSETWLSRHGAVAEAAAIRALEREAPGIDADARAVAAEPLQSFLEACPVCEAPVEETSPTACCGSVRDPRELPDTVLACPDCDAKLYEFPEAE